jgi:uncharacterized protein YkwD
MTVTPDSNLEPTASEIAIDEPVTIELENFVQPDTAPSSDVEDPSPVEMDTRSTSGCPTQDVLNIVNQERYRAGLSPLRLHSQLTAAAQDHCNDMARHNFMSHTGSNGSSFVDRIKRHGYNFRSAAENVAAGQSSAQQVMQSWMNSPGHRNNILSPNSRDIGIAYARGNKLYWTQVFGA